MYITAPIPISGNVFTLKSPRPSSGTAPVAIQITNNSSYVFGFTTGAEQSFIDPYTRSTYPLATVTDAIVMSPVYNAYALVGAGYMAADWLLPNEPASQADGALPISQLISQAIQSITSADGSITVTNPNGPSTDLKGQNINQLVGLPPPVNTGSTIQFYTDPLGQIWVAKNTVNGGNWLPARDAFHIQLYLSSSTQPGSSAQTDIVWDTAVDPYGMWNGTTGVVAALGGMWLLSAQIAQANTVVNQTLALFAYNGATNSFVANGTNAITGGYGGINTFAAGTKTIRTNAGTLLKFQQRATATTNLVASTAYSYATFDYLGTG